MEKEKTPIKKISKVYKIMIWVVLIPYIIHLIISTVMFATYPSFTIIWAPLMYLLYRLTCRASCKTTNPQCDCSVYEKKPEKKESKKPEKKESKKPEKKESKD